MWYHVTDSYLGKSKILIPHVPDNPNTNVEGDIPRICVSNSIFKCLRALIGRDYISTTDYLDTEENPCVYYTENNPYIPPECDDFRYNDERWFIKKTKFFYLARVNIYTLFTKNKIVATKEEKLRLPKIGKTIRCPKEMFIQSLLG